MSNKVSIICPVFNRKDVVERNILSVLNQSYNNIEYIVVDGGSTDGTVQILETYKNQIKYISEPDKGIYDAMNKGINMATGDWLLFIGSDDYFDNEAVLFELFTDKNYGGYDAILGKTKMGENAIFISKLNKSVLFFNNIHHQGIFYAKHLFNNFRYDISLTSNAEYELHLSMFLGKVKVFNANSYFVTFALGGLSSQAKFAGYRQEIIVRNKLIKHYLLRCILNLSTLCRFGIKKTMMAFGVPLHVYSKEK